MRSSGIVRITSSARRCALALLVCASAPALDAWQRLPLPPGVALCEVRDIRFSPAGALYVSYAGQGTWRSIDAGQTWQDVSFNLPALPFGGFLCFNAAGDVLIGPDDSADFAIYRLPSGANAWVRSAIDVAQGNADELCGKMVLTDGGSVVCLTSRYRVLRSTDGGASFHFTDVAPAAGVAGLLYCFTRSPVRDDLYIGTETGPEYVSSDEGATWTSIGKPGGNVRIGFDRLGTPFGETTHNANPIPRVLARWTGGTTWVESDTGLPDYADSRSFGLSATGRMYVGSYDVYASLDDGRTWSLAGSGFPTNSPVVQVQALTVGPDGSVYAGLAHGTAVNFGVWKLPPTPGGTTTAGSTTGGTTTGGTTTGGTTTSGTTTSGTTTGGTTTSGTTTGGTSTSGTTTAGTTTTGTTTSGTTTSGTSSGGTPTAGTTTGGHSGGRCGAGAGGALITVGLALTMTRRRDRKRCARDR